MRVGPRWRRGRPGPRRCGWRAEGNGAQGGAARNRAETADPARAARAWPASLRIRPAHGGRARCRGEGTAARSSAGWPRARVRLRGTGSRRVRSARCGADARRLGLGSGCPRARGALAASSPAARAGEAWRASAGAAIPEGGGEVGGTIVFAGPDEGRRIERATGAGRRAGGGYGAAARAGRGDAGAVRVRGAHTVRAEGRIGSSPRESADTLNLGMRVSVAGRRTGSRGARGPEIQWDSSQRRASDGPEDEWLELLRALLR